MSITDILENEIAEMEGKITGKREVEEVVEEPQPTEEVETENPIEPSTDQVIEEVVVEETIEEPEKKKERNDWKHRYKTLKAHHDSTTHSLRGEVANLTSENIRLTTKVDELTNELSNLKLSSEDIYKDVFSEEEVDIVGLDAISSMKKATKVAIEAAVKPLQMQLEEERKLRLQEKAQRVDELSNVNQVTFLSRLEELAPNYSKYDTDPKFHEWMKQPDDISGIVRSTLFKTAQGIGDVAGVARFFNDFENKETQRTETLESNIGPSSSKAVTVEPKKNDKPEILTRQSIDKFFDDCIRGKYRGKEKLRQEIEAKIDKAIASGMVQ